MAQAFKTNTVEMVWQYLQHLKISITKKTVDDTLQSHPFYPSLYSISDSFDKWKIENAAYELEDEQLDELQTPFAVYISGLSTGSDFVLVNSVTKESVSFIDDNKKIQTLSRVEFLKRWKKLAFIAQATDQSGEEDFEIKYKQERAETFQKQFLIVSFSVVIALVFTYLLSHSVFFWQTLTFSITHIIGLTLAIFLLLNETGNASAFIKSVCSVNKKTSCDAVLSSKGAKLFGISWAEYGFIYFLSGCIWLLLTPINSDSKLIYSSLVAVIVSVYIPYSIYYQFKVVKQWCPLCLAIQVVLAIELISSFIFITRYNDFVFANLRLLQLETITWLLVAVLIPISSWYYLKPLLLKSKEYSLYKHNYKRLQYNPDLFASVLRQEKAAPDGWQNLGIELGNPNAQHTIIKVCNPYCEPCAKAHKILEDIIKYNSNYKLRIIFTSKNDESDISSKPAKYMLAISNQGKREKTEKIVNDWYSMKIKSYNKFKEEIITDNEIEAQGSILNEMVKWCDYAEINYTPTIYIKSKRLPASYEISDLINII
jgi:uncharacterized membrane protein